MINRQLSRLLLCSILGSTTLISGCALVRKDSAPQNQHRPWRLRGVPNWLFPPSTQLICGYYQPHDS